jgi:hypothetical protein
MKNTQNIPEEAKTEMTWPCGAAGVGGTAAGCAWRWMAPPNSAVTTGTRNFCMGVFMAYG